MVISNELRIGNYLIKDERWVSVDALALMDMHRLPGEEDRYLPIILTSAVLDRCGFRNSRLRVSNDVGWAFQLEIINGEMVLAVKEYALPLGTKYLHQLQNLYYAITGGELKVDVDEAVV